MTPRAVLMGLLLGVGISTLSYFNDAVIRQTMLVGNYFPIAIFGVLLMVLLVINPLLAWAGWPRSLQPAEIAVVAALGLSACGWPGTNVGRFFLPVNAMPGHWHQTEPAWQVANVMAYVPGGTATLAPGHVQDWPSLVRQVVEAGRAGEPSPAGQVWRQLPLAGRRAFLDAADGGLSPDDTAALTRWVNVALTEPAFYDPVSFKDVAPTAATRHWLAERERRNLADHEQVALHRHLLVAAMPGIVLPPPRGAGALVSGGRADPAVTEPLLSGSPGERRLAFGHVPWSAWLPVIRQWGMVLLLLGLASAGAALVVHPQWSRRELLPYPIPRFLTELSARQPGRWLPDTARMPRFWIAGGGVFAVHLINGLSVWFGVLPEIPLQFNFQPLAVLFPTASRVPGAHMFFQPTLMLSVVGFSYFISRTVSFTLGAGQWLFLFVESLFLARGVAIQSDIFTAGGNTLLRMGACVGLVVMIVYVGRRYYAQVVRGCVGLPHSAEAPRYAVWSARLMVVAMVLASVWLYRIGMVAAAPGAVRGLGDVGVQLFRLFVSLGLDCQDVHRPHRRRSRLRLGQTDHGRADRRRSGGGPGRHRRGRAVRRHRGRESAAARCSATTACGPRT